MQVLQQPWVLASNGGQGGVPTPVSLGYCRMTVLYKAKWANQSFKAACEKLLKNKSSDYKFLDAAVCVFATQSGPQTSRAHIPSRACQNAKSQFYSRPPASESAGDFEAHEALRSSCPLSFPWHWPQVLEWLCGPPGVKKGGNGPERRAPLHMFVTLGALLLKLNVEDIFLICKHRFKW